MLYHRVSGSGAPLVLIHGLFGSMENLGAIARFLKQDFTVYSLDLPNHGRSPHADDMHLSAMAEELSHFLRAQGLQSAHMVGHSLGGKVCMELALREPDKVQKLVVLDIAPVAYSARHTEVFEGRFAVQLDAIESREEAEQQMRPYVQEAAVRSFLLKNLQKNGERYEWRMNLADLHQNYPYLIDGNCEGEFPRETLFLKGGDSDYIKQEQRDAILSRFPRAQLKVVPDTGHWLHAEKPELIAKLIRKFLMGN